MSRKYLIAAIVGGVYYFKDFSCSAVQSVASNRALIANIDATASSLQSTSKDLSDQSTEGGKQTEYTKDGKTEMVLQEFFGETGTSENRYYFPNGSLFAVVSQTFQYDKPYYVDPDDVKIVSSTKQEFYLRAT